MSAVEAALRAGVAVLCRSCGGTGRPPAGWLAAPHCPICKGSGVVPVRPKTLGERIRDERAR